MISNFLAGKAIYIILFAFIASGGLYIVSQLKELGRLELANKQLSASIELYKTKEALYNKLDIEYNLSKIVHNKQLNDLKQSLDSLKEQSNEAKDYLNNRVPISIINRLCEDGIYSSAVCNSR